MSAVCLTRANLHEWREELTRLSVFTEFLFVHATHQCEDPWFNFLVEGHHPSMRIFLYQGVHDELAELMREIQPEILPGFCICFADTESEFANQLMAPEAA